MDQLLFCLFFLVDVYNQERGSFGRWQLRWCIIQDNSLTINMFSAVQTIAIQWDNSILGQINRPNEAWNICLVLLIFCCCYCCCCCCNWRVPFWNVLLNSGPETLCTLPGSCGTLPRPNCARGRSIPAGLHANPRCEFSLFICRWLQSQSSHDESGR